MALVKPYYRCYRPNLKNTCLDYIKDSKNIKNSYDYIRKIEILYSRLEKIFEYVEPDDENEGTYSIQISSLLLDICTTIEANFKDILKYNGYVQSKNCNITDYYKIEKSHHLSSYEIKIPFWKGDKNIRIPFSIWKKNSYKSLSWYKAYNSIKHNMIENFKEATLDNLVDSFCALLIISAAQFYNDEFSIPNDLEENGSYGYVVKKDYKQTIRTPFIIKFPNDWLETEKYSFNWDEIKYEDNPFIQYSYGDSILEKR